MCASGGAAGASGTAGASGASGTSAGGSGGADCTAVWDDVNQKLAAAQVCNNLSGSPVAQCQGTVEGACCSVLVELPGSSQSNAYLTALKNAKTQCPQVCPAIACKIPQPGNCVQASGANTGVCE
jgi:hypothetical protein